MKQVDAYAALKTGKRYVVGIVFYVCLAVIFLIDNSKIAVNSYRLLLLLPALIFLAFNFRTQIKVLLHYPAVRWFLLYAGWMSLSLFWGNRPDKIENHLAAVLSALALIVPVIYFAHHRPSHLVILPLVYIVLGATALGLVLWHWQGWAKLDRYSLGHGVFDTHIRVGALAACIVFLSGFVLLNTPRKGSEYIIAALALCVGLWALMASQSRGAVVLLGVAIAAWLFLHPDRSYFRQQHRKKIGGICILAFCLMGSTAWAINCYVQLLHIDRGSAGSFFSRGLMDRNFVWENAWHQFIADPSRILWGFGWTSSAENTYNRFTANHYHSLYINTVFYSGFIGLTLLLAYLYHCIKAGLQNKRHEPWLYLVIGSMAAALFDMETLLVNPSAIMLTFLLPSLLLIPANTAAAIANRYKSNTSFS